jgi:hypothetical protein
MVYEMEKTRNYIKKPFKVFLRFSRTCNEEPPRFPNLDWLQGLFDAQKEENFKTIYNIMTFVPAKHDFSSEKRLWAPLRCGSS